MSSGAETPTTGYNIVITAVDSNRLEEAAGVFAAAFHLEPEPAAQILKSAPIVFLTGVSKVSLEAIEAQLTGLSELGVEFLVSKKLLPSTPRVIWPGKSPLFIKDPEDGLVQFVDFQWRGNAFVCPNCHETFVFKRIGNPLGQYLKVKDKVGHPEIHTVVNKPMPVIKSKPIPVVEHNPIPAVERKPIPAPPVSAAPEKAVKPPEQKIKEEPAPHKAQEEPVQMPSFTEPVSRAASDEGDVVELLPLDQSAVEVEAEKIIEPVKPTPPASRGNAGADSRQSVPPEAPSLVNRQELTENNQSANCNYNLFLTSIPDDKRLMATELIARIKGITVNEAYELANRLLVPVLKDVDEEKASICLKEFQKLGIQGRIIIRK